MKSLILTLTLCASLAAWWRPAPEPRFLVFAHSKFDRFCVRQSGDIIVSVRGDAISRYTPVRFAWDRPRFAFDPRLSVTDRALLLRESRLAAEGYHRSNEATQAMLEGIKRHLEEGK